MTETSTWHVIWFRQWNTTEVSSSDSHLNNFLLCGNIMMVTQSKGEMPLCLPVDSQVAINSRFSSHLKSFPFLRHSRERDRQQGCFPDVVPRGSRFSLISPHRHQPWSNDTSTMEKWKNLHSEKKLRSDVKDRTRNYERKWRRRREITSTHDDNCKDDTKSHLCHSRLFNQQSIFFVCHSNVLFSMTRYD